MKLFGIEATLIEFRRNLQVLSPHFITLVLASCSRLEPARYKIYNHGRTKYSGIKNYPPYF